MTDKAPMTVEQGDYEPDEIEFMQTLLDRYSEDGGMIRLVADHAAFMKIVRQYRLQSTAALEEEIKRLREAMRPFAEEADQVDSCEAHPNGCPAHYSAGWCADLTIGDFRRARTALEGRGS